VRGIGGYDGDAMRKWKPPKYIHTWASINGVEQGVQVFFDCWDEEEDTNTAAGLEITGVYFEDYGDVYDELDNVNELEQRLTEMLNELAKAYYEDER
jgi:hypothetical protein